MTTEHQPAPLCFIDTETTSLRADRQVWEVAAIRINPNGTTGAMRYFVDGVNLAAADPVSLQVGRFYDRHPTYAPELPYAGFEGETRHTRRAVRDRSADRFACKPVREVARAVERITRGATLVGSNPGFDADCLAPLLRACGLLPAWDDHHLIDVVQLGMGFLAAKGSPVLPPYSSSAVTAALGVRPAAPEEKHTAMGDVRWTLRLWDAIYGTEHSAGFEAREAESAAWHAENDDRLDEAHARAVEKERADRAERQQQAAS